jgi:hypothetical protein
LYDVDDTGPPYPPSPAYGSNAIGIAALGIAPIGDIPDFNIWDTVLSQYANSLVITTLIQDFFYATDQTYNFQQWFDLVFNIMTAQGWGLDVWGRILGIGRDLEILVEDFFGFKEALPGSLTFSQGAFFAGKAEDSMVYPLADPVYLRLLLAKAAFNITDGSIPSINRIMMNLFPGRGNAFVEDGAPPPNFFGFAEALPGSRTFSQGIFYNGQNLGGMFMTYRFDFPLTDVELAIVQSGVLPKPVGVESTISITPIY